MTFRSISNFDISSVMSSYKRFGGVYSKDELAKIKPQKKVYIVNMENSNAGGGTHWVLVSCLDPKVGVYFDSFALRPPEEVEAFLKRKYTDSVYNTTQVQDLYSEACGYYCMYVAVMLIKGHSLVDIVHSFSEDAKKNDRILRTKIKNLGGL